LLSYETDLYNEGRKEKRRDLMINILEDYIWRSIPEEAFCTNPNLRKKADEDGKILPYKGNTVVFLLDEDIKDFLAELQEELYQAVPQMFSEKLERETFHMTLHSLADGHPEEEGLAERMEEAEKKARQILARWKDAPPLRMKATWMFNMVHTSIVLGLMPDGEDGSWQRLDELYCALQEAAPLGDLCPHITLAYYRPGVYSEEEAEQLRRALHPVEKEVMLRMENLVIQNFDDMNHYRTV